MRMGRGGVPVTARFKVHRQTNSSDGPAPAWIFTGATGLLSLITVPALPLSRRQTSGPTDAAASLLPALGTESDGNGGTGGGCEGSGGSGEGWGGTGKGPGCGGTGKGSGWGGTGNGSGWGGCGSGAGGCGSGG